MKRGIFFGAIAAVSLASVFSVAIAAQGQVKFSLDNVQDAIADFRQVLAARKDDWGTSTVITNKLPSRYNRVQVIENEKRQIFDLAVMVYSKEFAQTIGQPEGFIVDMPEGLGMLAYTKVTQGLINECHINFAIKDSFKVNAKDQDYVSPKVHERELFGTTKINRENLLTAVPYEVMLDYGPIYIATPDHNGKGGEERIGKKGNGYIRFYTNKKYKGYHYFSWHIGCPSVKVDYVAHDWELWIAKEGVRYDYTITSYTPPEDFWHFSVPEQFISLMQATLDVGDRKTYLSPIGSPEKFTNKEIIK